MVTVLEGTGRFTIGGDIFILNEGETIVMPKDVPHAVFGEEKVQNGTVCFIFKKMTYKN